jgi:hypothetical protein
VVTSRQLFAMPDNRLKISRLRNIPYASSIQETLPFDQSFDVEYRYEGVCNQVVVQPILLHSIVIFLVSFPEGDGESMALVYNAKNEWSDIERESTGHTESIGLAIEHYYSNRFLFSASSRVLN